MLTTYLIVARDDFFDRLDDGDRPFVILRALNNDDVIPELHGNAVMAATGQVPDSVRQTTSIVSA